MPILSVYNNLKSIAETEFTDVVIQGRVMTLPTGDPLKLRLDMVDGSLIDIFLSVRGRYSYHWERRMTPKNDLFRHDNAPHDRWSYISTFPKHFHDGTEQNVVASNLSERPPQAIRQFLEFVRQKLLSESSINNP